MRLSGGEVALHQQPAVFFDPLCGRRGTLIDRGLPAQRILARCDCLGDHVHEYLIRNKREEWDSYKAYVTPYELERYLPIL